MDKAPESHGVIQVVLTGLVTGWAIPVPIGAVGAFPVALTARTSLPVGAVAALGIATVDGVYAACAGPPDAARQAYAAFLGITAVNPTTVSTSPRRARHWGLVSDALEGAVFVASW